MLPAPFLSMSCYFFWQIFSLYYEGYTISYSLIFVSSNSAWICICICIIIYVGCDFFVRRQHTFFLVMKFFFLSPKIENKNVDDFLMDNFLNIFEKNDKITIHLVYRSKSWTSSFFMAWPSNKNIHKHKNVLFKSCAMQKKSNWIAQMPIEWQNSMNYCYQFYVKSIQMEPT